MTNKIILERKKARFIRLANRIFLAVVCIAFGFIIGTLIK